MASPARSEERFHEEWLGMIQPVDGLVVSVPVLVEAQCAERQPPEVQRRLAELCTTDPSDGDAPPALADVPGFLEHILGWQPAWLRAGDALPPDLSLYVPEGGQIIKPSAALTDPGDPAAPPRLLFWDLGADAAGLSLDKPETRTGPWQYPASAKLDRLLRHTRVPIGVLTNRTSVRLLYAPHGESSGSLTFRVADLLEVGGRPILDALIMLLGATRLFGVAPEHQLAAILAESRKRQANVTNELADQVFDALQILLAGFEAAAERDGRAVLDAAYARADDHLYGGLLTQLLRLVFVLYAEDRGLMPVESELYAAHLSVLGLFEQLQADHAAHPDSMARRFGAYGRLCALFRAIYLGAQHGDLELPARRGQLFSPHAFPFLEGWEGEPGSAPVVDAAARAATRVPSVDDETVFRVLEKLLILRRQRLSYRALDVEQIGSVYEALMGYHVVRLEAEAVCLRPARVWLTGEEVLAEKPATRVKWLQETTGLAKGQADKLAKALAGTKRPADVLAALEDFSVRGQARRAAGRLAIQPGPERRRTSSHYTPRSLTAPIVAKTLEPLFRAMGEHPPSARILNLKVCDPAMGSGAFLVEACRYLADQLVLAWTREGRHDLLAGAEDVTLLARRLVAQRCLYGVDKNAFAVNLAKLSLWLVTLARDLPFTFIDHALRHGDSLVGLSFEQITAFHWRPDKQLELCQAELQATLDEAIGARQRILELAGDPTPGAQKEKEWLLRDAEDALGRVRLIGDLVVGAFFAADKDKDREKERQRRLELVLAWLRSGGDAPAELWELRDELRARTPAFHWMAEFPEVFWAKRPDPLDGDAEGGEAWIDAFVGNPPFAGKNGIAEFGGPSLLDWLKTIHEGAHGNADYSAHFFRRADALLGHHGTIGLIATNTIAQGDTRATGLQHLVGAGLAIYDATRSMPWPGDAGVTIAVVHMEKGRLVDPTRSDLLLDGAVVAHINSRLRAGDERADPFTLVANTGLSFQGSIVLGMGFVLTPEERDALVKRSVRNAERIFPYLGGEEVNTSPTQTFDRYVINFGEMSLAQTGQWPDLIEIVRAKVKPERDRSSHSRAQWWHFERPRQELYSALSGMARCLVTSQTAKHLCISFQPTDRVFTTKVIAFLLERTTQFAILQSRTHVIWAWRMSSTMKEDLSYTGAAFETFPFPQPDPRAVIPALEDLGQRLYDTRAAYMVATQQGLTQTYNRLKDPACHEPDILALRELHLELDRAVLAAYGWTDLVGLVPPYTTPRSDADKRAFSAFEDAVIDRLFALNAERAEAERLAGLAAAPAGKKAKKPKAAARGKKAKATPQLSLDPSAD
ncbi:MAG: DNA methyltransferase [Kofleriaceae bacterium]